ncbi:hypothetical protein BP00DRAFT_426645 [Aspergillus indologenus CBS 114.80]|uniref:Uncharacterized protein n=1 Tax=Aspergillus indologenus CBS 114.80 TaxID=1450541 RepID=A0A2V5I810_9EURO|nr:hypothetical protein BP00DRAFT_426645 [Aspergillus indologenus CBS 114.80]
MFLISDSIYDINCESLLLLAYAILFSPLLLLQTSLALLFHFTKLADPRTGFTLLAAVLASTAENQQLTLKHGS